MWILPRMAVTVALALGALLLAPSPSAAVETVRPGGAAQPAGHGAIVSPEPPPARLARPGPLTDRPFRLADELTDEAEVLGSRRDEAQAALTSLRRDSDVQLFVVFVHTFSGRDARDWADDTAVRSGLGDRDALLAVATRDRSYAYSVPQNFPLTDAQLAEVARVAIEPALSENDWAGAVVGAADGFRAALSGQPVPRPRITPGPPDTRSTGEVVSSIAWVALPILLALAVIGGIVGWRRSRRRRAERAAREQERARTEEVSVRANTLLVELDNELRASENELTLAVGEYGEAATAAFTAAVAAARQEVAEAFRLRLSVDEPGLDDRTRRARLEEIISRCEAADQRLDAEAEPFDRLRAIEPRVAELVVALRARQAATRQRLEPADSTLRQLHSRYTAEALAEVTANPQLARERLEFVATVLADADEAVRDDARPQAALAVRSAEEALGQADMLLDAVMEAAEDLRAARAAADALLVEIDGELVQGRAALAGPSARNTALAAAVAEAERVVAAVRAACSAPITDPRAALRRLEAADEALDAALATSVEEAQRAVRARAMLGQAVGFAQAEIQTASRYVATRRGAVGDHARAQLAEATRHLDQAHALAGPDPVAALAAAHQAARLANEAGRSARSDVDSWPSGGYGGYGGRSQGTEALLGAVLGGILAGGMGGGGGWGGGFGGSGSRSRRGGGGGFGGGGFGGGGGRRGGGGRF
ncbi:TPM domain-containing protein [Micromonospora sp. NPDC050187]|uniref:TPM domain-containing protein n=1 Tax=Micromonospora sp. NPDC050187 TaxID=3364277 RepID=UPI003793928C